ncbi:NAD-dependent epimerase/dehydratase family protein [Glaesserella parasuis]|uniref:NAD-dependent epimerase/dehydratase family protein n=1 Tax=Glaesserella parasuis TaxID=738 RepID=UPI0021BD03F8|nr:NAD-dependent epimerase/dehydratase family protein [Glaesserella parasuis]MCT8579604.1 NAD-dependent epimerase/dehydratase family protein [Glaesserella parasuis]MCT8593775.1 NAD-dependent epimerase/dehydratase family protein [Glaesserella parasuis]MCT8716496.1 NAD-dependent epimerase/dehydratase family protein [Glaesserella parasuis]MCT8718683.1 NAD-dependent epimerase/dehydratase family protein [Glaesserella parasuis]MCT8722398.1 NAD-dependent epimerase/dehydratase family protein [Glaesser
MKKVLITGKNSYIGQAVESWLLQDSGKYQIFTLDMRNSEWVNTEFTDFDTIFHVAGIANFSKDISQKELYRQVNTQLAVDVAQKAKLSGVKQFIFMSSIIVYGDSTLNNRVITASTEPSPNDIYGDSKWQAEQGLSQLAEDNFKIAILRPPMIYGKGSKGNYPKLSKLAKLLPIFPDFYNQRSMLHIDNLCEFIKQIIDKEKSGLFFPQNKEYVSTSELVREIAEVSHRKVFLTKAFNPVIRLMFKLDIVKKLFGNLVYEKSMSQYDFEYQIRDFRESVRLTESK